MTGYGADDYYREILAEKEKARLAEEELAKHPKLTFQCPICKEWLEHEGEYHSDRCDIIKGFLRYKWSLTEG